MTQIIRRLLLAMVLTTGIAPAIAQQFPSVPDHTVIGRIGTGSSSGPSQAIPFTNLFSQIREIDGTLTINPPVQTTNQGIVVNQTLPFGSAGINNPYSANLFSIVNNGYQTPPGGTSDSFGLFPVVSGFRLNYQSAGSGLGHFPIQIGGLFATKATSAGQQLVGLNGTVYSNINSSGNDSFWATIGYANIGPLANINSVYGFDAEVAVAAGASVINRLGVVASSLAPTQGSAIDAAFAVTAAVDKEATTAPWHNAMVLWKTGTDAPIDQSIIIANAPFTVQYGFKLDNLTFAQKFIDIGATKFQMDGSGNATFGPTSIPLASNTVSIGGTLAVQSTSGAAFSVGPSGQTNAAFKVDASTASMVAGLNVTGAVTGGTVAVTATDSGSNTALSVNAKGSGSLRLGNSSSGQVQIAQGGGGILLATAITYGGVTFNNAVTGSGNLVGSVSPAFTTPNLGTPSAVTLTNGSGLPTSGLTGTLLAAQEPAHTGGCTNSAGSLALSCTNNTSIMGGGATNTILAGATGWVGVGLICNATESFCFLPQPQAGTISNLYVNVGAAPGVGQTYTVTVRKNSTNQTVTCTISGGSATSCNDTTHSFAVAAADNVSVQIAASGAATTVSVANFGFKLATTSP